MLTQEIIYKTLGSTVELVCPIVNTSRPMTWFGPLNYKLYAVGMDVSQDVSTQVGINETDEKSILLIHQFTEESSGKFRCSDFVDKREFNLKIKSKIYSISPFSNYAFKIFKENYKYGILL